jgi:phosphoesterase RecJ-like protein
MTIEAGLLAAAIQKLHGAERIQIFCHQRPDGDALGSLLGLGLSLEAIGKQVQMVSVDGVPAGLRHLKGAGQIVHKPVGEFDLVCIVDCSDLQRTGDFFPEGFVPQINIDHHITNLNFAGINLVDSSAVSTTQLIAELLSAAGLPFTKPVAEALLTGLITDTIGFRTSNISPAALRLAAGLVEMGANLSELYHQALVSRSFEATCLWGAGLSNLQRQGSLVWTTLTLEMRRSANYPGRDDADMINVLSAISDAEVAVIFVEQPNGHVKVSWRARPGLDVSGIAQSFGGGGHASAAGANILGQLQEVRESVLSSTHSLIQANEAQRAASDSENHIEKN